MVVSLAFSPLGRWLVSGSIDRTARLWNTATGEPEHVFTGHQMGVGAAAFSADETRLATGSWDDSVRIWDLQSLELITALGGHQAGVQHLAFAPDGRTLLVIGGTGVLKFWSLGALRECGELRLPAGTGPSWVAVARTGGWFGVAAQSGDFQLFDARTSAPSISR